MTYHSEISTSDPSYAFLRTDFRSPFLWDRISYPTIAHAYQAAKSRDRRERAYIAKLSVSDAAHYGTCYLFPGRDWDKEKVLLGIIRARFSDQCSECRRGLVLTRDARIEYIQGGNGPDWWCCHTRGESRYQWNHICSDKGDEEYWGVTEDGIGKNRLGEILMRRRNELLDEGLTVAVCGPTTVSEDDVAEAVTEFCRTHRTRIREVVIAGLDDGTEKIAADWSMNVVGRLPVVIPFNGLPEPFGNTAGDVARRAEGVVAIQNRRDERTAAIVERAEDEGLYVTVHYVR